jgi:hypothetical protein
MAREYRKCVSTDGFNIGQSRCPADRGKIKALMFAMNGMKLPSPLTAESIRAACHADYPNRLYCALVVDEYAPSGGDVQTSAQGYGSSKVTGYAAQVDAYTVEYADAQMRANVLSAKNVPIDVYLLNDKNIIYGERVNKDFVGSKLSGLSQGGQRFDSSGQVAQLIVSLYYKDIEKTLSNEDFIQADFDVLDAITGLTEVQMVEEGENVYRIVEKYGGNDVTPYVGAALTEENVAQIFTGATAATYSDTTGLITITGDVTGMGKPSVLFTAGLEGLIQVP